MKTAVSVWSFRRWLLDGTETELSIISKAKEFGFDAIEFTDHTIPLPSGVTEAEHAKQLCEEAKRVGIEICNFAIIADLLGGCECNLETEVERVKRKVDIAAILGAKMMRHDTAFRFPNNSRGYQGFSNVLPRFAEGCRKITEYAESVGIKTMVENHGQFCQDSDRMEQLVNTVAHPNFGLLVDFGNFLCVDEDPAVAVGRTAPYAFHAHAKDFIRKSGNERFNKNGFFLTRGGNYLRGTVIGHGVVPIEACVKALKNADYDGYLTLEFEGPEMLEQALRSGCDYLKELCK